MKAEPPKLREVSGVEVFVSLHNARWDNVRACVSTFVLLLLYCAPDEFAPFRSEGKATSFRVAGVDFCQDSGCPWLITGRDRF